MQIREIIDSLNGLTRGEVSTIETRLDQAAAALSDLRQPDLADVVSRARAALSRGDVEQYRRLLAQATSRLGHVD